jgi:hypothetical protein
MKILDEAERLAQESFVLIVNTVGSEYVFYVGTTVYGQNTTGYCNEALACVLDTKRNPVVFPEDSNRCTVDQVIHDLQFQVMHLTQLWRSNTESVTRPGNSVSD